MNKIGLLLVLVLSIVIFSSCEKEEPELNTVEVENTVDLPFKVSVENGVLNFETKADYELALDYLAELETNGELDQFEKQLGFNSYRSTYQYNQQKMDDIQDDILATFLNPSNKVIIEQKMFEINLIEDRVSVWEHQDCELKSASSDMLIGEYRCDDDVFDLLDGGPNLKSVKGVTCSNKKVGIGDLTYFVESTDRPTYISYYIQYIKGGIYYTLNSRIKCKNEKVTISLKSTSCEYRKIRKSLTTVDSHTESGFNWERNYRPYWGTARLASYNFSVTFSAKDGDDSLFTDSLNNTCID